MRNALVVLVPLCFGVAPGFIIPPGAREVILDSNDNVNFVHNSARKTRNVLNTTRNFMSKETSATPIFNEKAVNIFLDTPLYEYNQKKKENVKPRSFIFIKQNSLKPEKNPLYYSPIKISRNNLEYLFNMNKVFEELPRQFSIGYMSQKLNSNTTESYHQCNKGPKQKKIDTQFKPQANLKLNEHRKYSEIFMAPILRAAFKNKNTLDNYKFKYLTIDPLEAITSYLFKAPESKSLKPDYDKNPGNTNGQVAGKKVPLDKNELKNYRNIGVADKSLLDELIKQKLNEQGSLFTCQDCLKKITQSTSVG